MEFDLCPTPPREVAGGFSTMMARHGYAQVRTDGVVVLLNLTSE